MQGPVRWWANLTLRGSAKLRVQLPFGRSALLRAEKSGHWPSQQLKNDGIAAHRMPQGSGGWMALHTAACGLIAGAERRGNPSTGWGGIGHRAERFSANLRSGIKWFWMIAHTKVSSVLS